MRRRRGLFALAATALLMFAASASAQEAATTVTAPEAPSPAPPAPSSMTVEMQQTTEGQTPPNSDGGAPASAAAAVPTVEAAAPATPEASKEDAKKTEEVPSSPAAAAESGSAAPSMRPALIKRSNPRRVRPSPSGLSPYEDKEPWSKQKHGEEEAGEFAAFKAEEEKEEKQRREDAALYGTDLETEPAFHLDTAAFQPSHILEFIIPAGGEETLYEQVEAPSVGSLMRGDYYCTSGDSTLSLIVTITGPDGSILYAEGPEADDDDEGGGEGGIWHTEGSFRFIASKAGLYSFRIQNPSESSERTVAFAFLLGKDDDDAFAPSGIGGPPAQPLDEEDADGVEGGAGIPGVGVPKAANAEEAVNSLKRQISRLHVRLDELISLSHYADVRFKRHLQTQQSTSTRLLKYTLAETAVIILSVALSILFVSRLNIRSPYASVYGGGGGGGLMGGGGGRGKYGLV